jgi:hypothetical protein
MIPSTIEVSVVDEDIRDGLPLSSLCPVARALKRECKTERVTVYNTWCVVDGTTYSLPEEAWAFITCFDSGSKVQPIKFTMMHDLPEEGDYDFT